MHKFIGMIVAALIMGPTLADAKTFELQGELTSGALLIAKVPQAQSVSLNGEILPLTPSDHVVFGFGRDQHGQQELKVVYQDGTEQRHQLSVQKRTYKIDRVDGVPQRTVTPDPAQQERARKEAEQVWLARNSAKTSQRMDFLKPVLMPAKGRISGVYGSQRIFNGTPRNPHFGLDIAAPTGSPVHAPWAGKVILAEPDLFYSGGTLIIDHGYGITSTYIHLHKLHAEVGDIIEQGQRIAEIGATGRVTGPHLDWRINWGHQRLDPALVMESFSEAATNPVPVSDR